MRRRLDSILVLDQPRLEVNVGSAMRSALAFGCDAVFLVGRRYEREPGDVFNAQRHLDVIATPSWARTLELLGPDISLVVVERLEGAVPLPELTHPPRAAYVFGPEDGSVDSGVIARARHRISIPHARPENRHWGCLNLGAAVSVVLYDRFLRGTAPVPSGSSWTTISSAHG